jgi:hypothetical protein
MRTAGLLGSVFLLFGVLLAVQQHRQLVAAAARAQVSSLFEYFSSTAL